MTSIAFPSGRRRPAGDGPRHRAAEAPGRYEVVVDPWDLARAGRHAEPEWSRELFDPSRDGDAFDWLGFAAQD